MSSDRPIIIGLTGLAGAGKDTVADALVHFAGFRKLAFADMLREEIADAFELLQPAERLLHDRDRKETPTEQLALGWCNNIEFVQAVNAAVYGGNMPLGQLDEPRSPRQILQWWGTEYRRAQDADYWTSVMAQRLSTLIGQGSWRLVVTDCRFPNEAHTVRRAGGELWQVFRPGLPLVEGGHASQTDGGKLKPEHIVVNNASVNELQHQVLRLLTRRHGGAVLPIHVEGAAR